MLNPSLNRRVTGKGVAAVIVLLALGLTLPLAALSSQAPVPPVPVVHAIEFVPPTPTMATPVAATSPLRVAPPALPRTAAFVTAESPAVVAEAVLRAAPQNQGGTLSGTVLDPSAAVIPGATIVLRARSSGTIRRTLSNEAGVFAFTQLPPDNYSATVDVPDFKQGKFTYTVTDTSSVARFNVILPLGLTTFMRIAAQAPPGLKCFSLFGAVKADGTPFTAADCPGGSVFIAPAKPVTPVFADPVTAQVISVNPPPAAVPTPGQRPIRVGGSVQAGNLLFHPSPAYPDEARSKGIQGTVILSGIIAEDGQFRSLKIISSSDPLLETSAIETIQTWRYKPTLLNGAPVEVPTTITLDFTIE